MGSFSNYLENKLLDHLFGKAAYTAPTIYVALSTADPTEDGSGLAQPSGNGYARVSTAAANWNAAANGIITNVDVITFPTASGAWGNITHFALFDAASAGNMIGYGALTTARNIISGDIPQFGTTQMSISQD